MTESVQQFLDWINAHPGWALVILFFTAWLDSMFVIGAFVPAAIVLFGVGALVALETLEFWPTIAIAAAGAVAGDLTQFWLGRWFQNRLFEWPLLRRYPDVVANGRSFFDRHGGKSVLLARFLGPLRAVTSAIAGVAGMKLWLFLVTDTLAATLWAATFILPGVVFGASLGLAAEVAGRLAVLLLTVTVLLILVIWLTVVVARQVRRRAERWMGGLLDWSRRHRLLRTFGAALADPDQPETPVLLGLATLLIVAASALLIAFWGIELRPTAFDYATLQAAQSYRTPVATALAAFFALLGSWPVYVATALAMLLTLAIGGHRRAAAHVLAALLFGFAASVLFSATPSFAQAPGGRTPQDFALCATIYGFAAALFATRRGERSRQLLYIAAMVLMTLIWLSNLYLGRMWYSLGVAAILSSGAWVAALGLGYRRHRGHRLDVQHALVVLAAFFTAAGLTMQARLDGEIARHAPNAEPQLIGTTAWWNSQWSALPSRRLDLRGRDKQFLNLQWAGWLPDVEQSLLDRGWQHPQPRTLGNSLRWLAQETPVGELPLLPRFHAGHHAVLTMRRDIDGDRQYLLRLWPSGYQLDGGPPLWVGTLVVQQARGVARLFRYPVNENIFTAALSTIDPPPAGFEARNVQRAPGAVTVRLLRPLMAAPDHAG